VRENFELYLGNSHSEAEPDFGRVIFPICITKAGRNTTKPKISDRTKIWVGP